MNCPRCGRELIWNSDFDAEDVGIDVPGIASFFTCLCGVSVEVFTPFEREDLDDDNTHS